MFPASFVTASSPFRLAINADAKLREVFGKDQITMFELAGIVGKHLG